MRVEAEAKLNLCLAIKGTDGNRHIIDSIFVPAGIKDIIYVEKSEKTSVSYTDGRKYERDTAAAVAEAVSRRYGTGGARILIEKRIPEGAGLGGSSADAGAVARALDALYRIGGIDPRLLVSIGSDVPYFYFGGAARVSGTGEVCTPLSLPPLLKTVLVPSGTVNTGECYRLYDETGGENGDVDAFLEELLTGRIPKPFNALRHAAQQLNPMIEKGISILEKAGFTAGMTGSGSAVFGLESNPADYIYKTRKLFQYASGFDVYAEKEQNG